MPNHIIAAGLNNPASNWLSQWKGGWDSTPSTSVASGSTSHTGLIMLVLIMLVVAVLAGLKKIAS
jgi:hypothetical protein